MTASDANPPSFPLNIPSGCPFPVHNIPFGIFSTKAGVGLGDQKRAGVAAGEYVIELDKLVKYGIFDKALTEKLGSKFAEPYLNGFAELPVKDRRQVRDTIIQHLQDGKSPMFANKQLNTEAFVPLDSIKMHLPMHITDYTDFMSSLVHAENSLMPFGMKVPPAFFEYPMAYNGRISSIAVSGTDVIRPCGFFKPSKEAQTRYQPSAELDFEVEMGAFISKPVEPGSVVTAENAPEHIFGYVLLNDWSSRDIQKHEMAPLGPMHSKSFLTSISPWIVTFDALQSSPSAVPGSCVSDVLPLLKCDEKIHGLFDIDLRAILSRNGEQIEIVRSNLSHAHWSLPQMASYQSSSGCGINTGDLLGSGTLSAPDTRPQQRAGEKSWSACGCLLEVNAINHKLPDVGGREVKWLEDGDELTFEGFFTTADGKKAGFGGVSGLVRPATKFT